MNNAFKKKVIGGAILAGGNAIRLGGIAKGMIETEKGISIVEHLIEQFYLAGIVNVVILSNTPKQYQQCGIGVLEDLRKGNGPLGGIETALIHLSGKCDAVMFAPCDMPNLTGRELSSLKKAFIRSQSLLVCTETADFFWHPLCSVVHNALVSDISSAIDRGKKTVHKLWKQLGAEGVRFDDVSPFFNLNSISDVQQWQKDKNEKANVC